MIGIPLIALLLLVGCDIKREAIGADDEIMVITDLNSKEAITAALESVFNDTIYTPKPEAEYKLIFIDPSGYDGIKELNNVIIGSVGNDIRNPATKLVKTLLGPERFMETLSGSDQIIFSYDQFSKSQLFMILSANNSDDLMARLNGKREWIKNQFEIKLRRRQEKFLLSSARQTKTEKRLAEKYPWSIKIPWGWEVIKDSLEANFVWLGRETPYQWIAIHHEPGIVASDSAAAANYAIEFPLQYFGHIQTNPQMIRSELTDFKEWSAWHYSGIWESVDDAKGGPFSSYLFYDGKTDQTYFIYTLLHFPGKRKNMYLKQLDVIASSFEVDK